MEKMKQIQGMLKTDRYLVSEMKRLIGIQSDSYKIIELQKQLSYSKVDLLLEELKGSRSIGMIADKVVRVENEVKKIREIDFQVCMYLNTVPVVACKTMKREVKESKRRRFDFSEIDGLFSGVGSERIPVVVSESRVIDLVKMPHLLVAGQTGSGKSVFLNMLILSVIRNLKVDECQLALIDPKRVEFSLYRDEEHLWAPVATKYDDSERLLDRLVEEMEKRYESLEELGVRSLESANEILEKKIPYIVVVIDELADLMMVSGHGVEDQITRLAQLARAVGIHLVLATQRPVVEIMTGLIKANMPARISFKVASKQDSRVILDEPGAEGLKGTGEMIFKSAAGVERHQGLWVSEEQIKRASRKWKT
jgi:Cdc6-like AAA superfamily ATPase